jgi:hypothetical protein
MKVSKYITSTIPPQIIQSFSRILLTTPCPKFHEDEEDIWMIYQYLKKLGEKKLQKTPGKKKKIEAMERRFLATYEWIKTQKEDSAAKEKNKTQEPFYWLECSTRSNREILTRFKYKARRAS